MDASKTAYVRNDIRRDIVLEARVIFDGNGILSRVKNLSSGGACLTLPFPCSHYRPMTISAVEIDGIGHFSVTKRWSSDFLVGLQFSDYNKASRMIKTFFTNLDSGTFMPDHGPRKAFQV